MPAESEADHLREQLQKLSDAIRSERYARSRMVPMFEGQRTWTQEDLDRRIAQTDKLMLPSQYTGKLHRS